MSNVPSKPRSRKHAADHWAQLLSGTADATQAENIRRWQQGDPERQAEFDHTLDLLARVDELAGHPRMKALIDGNAPTRREPATVHRLSTRRKFAAVGVAVLLLLTVGVVFFQGQHWLRHNGAERVDRYVTRVGERKTIPLPDGSEVTLNTATEILVNFNEGMRRVRLERGEALFEVTPDPARPFTVNLDNHAVSVLGTAFNLRKNPADFTLAVVEGVVLIHRQEEQPAPNAPLLKPHMGDARNNTHLSQQRVMAGTVVNINTAHNTFSAFRQNNMNNYLGWRSGILQFQDQPLSAVVKELNRYMGKKILIEDASIMNLNVYAAIDLEQLPQALTDLEHILPVMVEHYYDRIVMSARKDK